MNIYLDYDQVLVNLLGPWLSWLKETHGASLTPRDVKKWNYIGDTYGENANDFFKQVGIYDIIKPLPNAISFVENIKDVVSKDKIFVISYCQDGQENEKKYHAKKYFDIDNFIPSREKWKLTSNGILIDDNPDYILNHVFYNRHPGILFNNRFEYAWAKFPEDHIECKLLNVCTTYENIILEIKKYV